jgi:hypothetical protein
VLTLTASGWTYFYTFVLLDIETESLWLPVNVGEGSGGPCGCLLWSISGPLAGRMLPAMPSSNTTWDVWFSEHPDTKIMHDPWFGDD